MLDDFFAGKHIAKLLGGLEHVLFLHILGIIIPTAFHIFRGVETTNQKINRKRSFIIWPHLSTNLTFKPHKWERREYQWIINRILTGILMEKAGTMDGKRMICIYYMCAYLFICVISQIMVIDGIQRLYAFARSLLSPWPSGWISVESSKLLAAVSDLWKELELW